MRRAFMSLFLLFGPVLAGPGCEDGTSEPLDRDAPAAPRGVTSITGDERVTLVWFPNEEWDLDGYRVYRNDRPSGTYGRLGWVPDQNGDRVEYVDRQVVNGLTYYYAVSAVDHSGNESPLSPEAVYDTPRPEGFGVHLTNYHSDPVRCAYDFSRYERTDYDDPDADLAYVYENDTGAWMFGLNVGDVYTELQDAGYTNSMEEISYAPLDGWSPRAAVEMIEGHTYIVWTRDDHYAKFRAVRVRPDEIVFDWAYQVDPENRELRERGGVLPAGAPKLPKRAVRPGDH